MPVPTENHWNIRRLNKVFALTAGLTLAATFWMLWHDFDRQWRHTQTDYFNARSAMALFTLLGYESPDEQVRRAALQRAVDEAKAALQDEAVQLRIQENESILEAANGELQAVQLAYGNANAELGVLLFDYEESKVLHGEEHPKTRKALDVYETKKSQVASLKERMDSRADKVNAIESGLKEIFRARDDAQKTLALYEKGIDNARRAYRLYGPGLARGFFNFPGLDFASPKGTPGREEIRQVFTKDIRFDYNFLDSYVIDRCITCHVSIDDPNFTPENFVAKAEKVLNVDKVRSVVRDENARLRQKLLARVAVVGDEPALNEGEPGRRRFVHDVVLSANAALREIDRPMLDEKEFVEQLAGREGLTRGAVIDELTLRIDRILGAARPVDPKTDRPIDLTDLDEIRREAHIQSLVAAVNIYLRHEKRPPMKFGKVLRAHPDLDMFLSPDSPHPMKKMGCTVCHEGSGEETDFILAAHTPKTKDQKQEWKKAYYETELGIPLYPFHVVEEFWERPMLRKEYTSASCVKCHHETFDLARYRTLGLPAAENIVHGRKLFTEVGCINCHNVEGLGDSRRVGTDLTHVGDKLSPGFMERWVEYPANFRPSTRMPHFFGQENNLPPSANEFDPDPVLRNQTEIQAIVHYLQTFSRPIPEGDFYALPDGVTGDPGRGEQLFTSIGCLACHANLDAKDPTDDGGRTFGEVWITADLMDAEALGADAAAARFEAMSKNERVQYAKLHLTPERREEAQRRKRQAEVAAAEKGEDAPDMYVPAALTRFAPALSGMGTKLAPDPEDAGQVEHGMRWMYNWLREPRHYASYTKMPRLFDESYYWSYPPEERLARRDQDLMDLAAYLLSLRNDDFDSDPFPRTSEHDRMRGELLRILLGGQNTTGVVERILRDEKQDPAEPYGRLTAAVVQQAYRSFGGGDAGRQRVGEIIRDRSSSLVERQALFLGMKMISHYGCYSCHTIAGFEDATRPGTDMTQWAEKFMSQLDFAFYSPPFEHEVESKPEVYGKLYREDAAYAHLIEAIGGNEEANVLHHRASFAYHKMRNPRIWDREKIKKPYEKLKMPNFFFSEDEARALTTFLLSRKDASVRDTVQIDYEATPAGKVATGRALVEELNCLGCHTIEGNEANLQQYYVKDPRLSDENPITWRFTPPLLWGEGSKVRSDWLYGFLNNVEMLRPWMQARMPSFYLTPEQTTMLVEYFAGVSQDESRQLAKALDPVHKHLAQTQTGDEENGLASDWFLDEKMEPNAAFLKRYALAHEQVKPFDFDLSYAAEGRQGRIETWGPVFDNIVKRASFLWNLYNVNYPFERFVWRGIDDNRFKLGEEFFYNRQCLACHVAGDPTAPGTSTNIKAPNFALTHKRLRYEWVAAWVQDPQALMPGTNMPQVFPGESAFATLPPDERSALEAKFWADPDEQMYLLIDFLYALGERGYTAIQPGGAVVPEAGEAADVEFDFGGGEEEKPAEDVEFDFD